MDPAWKAVCFLVALVLLVIAAFGEVRQVANRGVHFGWLGLVAFVLPFLWTAADQGWFDD